MEALMLVIGTSYWVNNEKTDCMKHAAGRIKEGSRGKRCEVEPAVACDRPDPLGAGLTALAQACPHNAIHSPFLSARNIQHCVSRTQLASTNITF